MLTWTKRVTPDEVAEITREAVRLTLLGDAATAAEIDALVLRKIDVLQRIAMDPGPYVDQDEAAEVRALALQEAAALRAGMRWSRGEP